MLLCDRCRQREAVHTRPTKVDVVARRVDQERLCPGCFEELVTALGLAVQEDLGGISVAAIEHRPVRRWAATG
ncbi:MAG: hypothetical protein K6T75_08955, partial [Acetobacteraceae bacterium]|nr:hypothetical protein [Acetobacteraceae bacterium]